MKKALIFLLSGMMLLTSACGGSGAKKDAAKGGPDPNAAKYSFKPGEKIDKKWQFATLAVGSAWYVYGATIANVVTTNDKGLTITVMPHSGGVGNMLMLQKKQADIGLGFNCVNAWAYNGTMAFEKTGANKNLRGLVGTLDQMYVGIAIRNGSGIKAIRDIAKNKMPIHLYTSETGSASEYTTRLVLKSIGCSYEDIIKWGGSVTHTDFSSIIAAYQDGKCDFFMQHISVGHPAFAELCTTADVTLGELDKDSLDFMQKNGYSVATLPKGSFNKQAQDVKCAGITTSLVTTTDLPDAVAYRIVKQIYEHPEELKTGHAGLGGFNRKTCFKPELYGGFPLHPGAEKYYKEAKLM